MLTYALNRLLASLSVVVGIVVITFLVIHLIPGDPASAIAGPTATQETIDDIRRQLGLDRSLPVQFVQYVGDLVRLDFGRSFRTGSPILHEMLEAYPKTLILASLAISIAILVGVPLGVISALNKNTFIDLGSMTIAIVGVSIPNFWLGLLLMWLFAVELRVLPSMGSDTPLHFVLPSITLAMGSLALIARQTRAAMLEVMTQDYVRTARAKGLPRRAVVNKHALRNALIPTLTVVGVNFGIMLGGSVVVESVFSIRGLGLIIVTGILQRDYPIIQTGVLIMAVNFTAVNLIVDLLYGVVDPRIQYT